MLYYMCKCVFCFFCPQVILLFFLLLCLFWNSKSDLLWNILHLEKPDFKWWIQVIWFDFLYNFISFFFYNNSLLNNNYIFQEDIKCLMVPEVLPRCKKGKLKIKFKVNIRFMCLVSLFSIKVIVVVASFRY